MNDTTREADSAVGIAISGSVFSTQDRAVPPDTIGQLPAGAANLVRHLVTGGLDRGRNRSRGRGLQLVYGVRAAVMSGFTEAMGVISEILAPAVLACLIFAPTADPARTDGRRSPGAVSTSGRDEGKAGSRARRQAAVVRPP